MSVLVACTDPSLRRALSEALGRAGIASRTVPCAGAEHHLLGAQAFVLDLGGGEGRRAIERARRLAPALPIVALLRSSEPAELVAALAAGADATLCKPFEPERLEAALARLMDARSARCERPIASDPPCRQLMERLEALAPTSLTVALCGEAGTGRTYLARWLHQQSAALGTRLVELQCAELAEMWNADAHAPRPEDTLLEAIDAAAGGTLLLEEVCDLPLASQELLVSCLRAGRLACADDALSRGAARVVVTSRRAVAAEVAAQRLLPELGIHFGAEPLWIPALRERPLDLPALAQRFLERAARAAGEAPAQLDAAALAVLAARRFPGNLPELEGLMRRAALLFAGRRVDLARLARPLAAAPPLAAAGASLDLATLERDAIERALAASGGDRTLAARALGIHVRTLRNKLRVSR